MNYSLKTISFVIIITAISNLLIVNNRLSEATLIEGNNGGDDGSNQNEDGSQGSLEMMNDDNRNNINNAILTNNYDNYEYYQPSLIGFRCEGSRELTAEGVNVIEANVPVTLTLFGESFTRDTIVAFTTEFQPEILNEPQPQQYIVGTSTGIAQRQANNAQITNSSKINRQQEGYDHFQNENSGRKANSVLIDRETHSSKLVNLRPRAASVLENEINKRKFEHRMRTTSRSYDCTDYDRVISYRLTRENILSPNVARLTVTLPELDMGNLYYFCLKQPQLTLMPQPPPTAGLPLNKMASAQSSNNNNSKIINNNYNSYSNNNNTAFERKRLVWVHQGDEPWVTLMVEAPTLTVTADCILMLLLLFLSAVTSGLNLGLMSLDMNELTVISSCGDPRERAHARTIAPLRKRGNYLLCSLLFGNVMVNATLTVILEQLTSGVVAVIGSTLAIVVLGEIVPQAFCARQGLAIGAKTIYLTYAFMIITFPLSYPISLFLDYVLGQEEGHVYDRERLMEFIRITGHHTQLDSEEVAIISGAMKLKNIKVHEIMTRIEDVFMLPIDCKLDRETIKRIIEKGYSRVPVYEFDDRKQIIALILAKDLALLDPDDHTPIASMLTWCKHPLIFIDDDTTLDVALNEFKTGKSHMAVVRQIYDDGDLDKYYEAIGVVTLEDVIEEVLQVEINDETDTLSDNRRKRRRANAQVHLAIEEKKANGVAIPISTLVSSTSAAAIPMGQESDAYGIVSGGSSSSIVGGSSNKLLQETQVAQFEPAQQIFAIQQQPLQPPNQSQQQQNQQESNK